MKLLKSLLGLCRVFQIVGNENITISSITFDTRKIETCSDGETLYIAQKGVQTDGHLYIDQAIEKGARAIVCEKIPENIVEGVCYVQVADASIALGRIASAFYNHPSRKLKLVGITGTNGKTTTVTLLHRLFMSLGYPTGLLSTIVNKINETEIPTTHTTPDAIELNRLLNAMVEAGCSHCFMEVSSHAIVQHRIEGLQFAGGIFSNITHDHLDFHKTFLNYIQAKKSFFNYLSKDAFALTNLDDKNGETMVDNSPARKFTYSINSGADFKAKIQNNSFDGLHLVIDGTEVYFKICGKFNTYNLLAIYGTAILLGENKEDVLVKMSNLEEPNGRFQIIKGNHGKCAVIDYAHTPDALKNVLSTIKEITENSVKVITVVGCGGNRDALKRPVMAEVACQYSDKVILTSDNPRNEDPRAIISDMEAGVPAEFKNHVVVIENREDAIKTACMIMEGNDVLLIAGKGHETYQEIKNVKHHFDDSEVVAKYIN